MKDRIFGCILGGACGDALGAPVEFLTYEEIKARYGPGGIRDFDRAYGTVGAITDDTQMTLFTVEGLIRASVRSDLKGICHPPTVIHHAYLRWLATQDGSQRRRPEHVHVDGWLIKEKRLWAQRAPGNTCLSALRSNKGLGELAQNDSKGCGGVMRAAPIGFVLPMTGDLQQTLDVAIEAARTTHGHPSGFISAGALALIIGLIATGEGLPAAVVQACRLCAQLEGSDEVCTALDRAVRLSSEPDWRDRLTELGSRWVSEEALAIAVLCALAGENPEEAIIAAVNHGGDSDSTGSIAGNIVGTLHGSAELPARWVSSVELRDVIENLAHDLAAVVEQKADAELIWDRYPGH